jgi:hypothetical protein
VYHFILCITNSIVNLWQYHKPNVLITDCGEKLLQNKKVRSFYSTKDQKIFEKYNSEYSRYCTKRCAQWPINLSTQIHVMGHKSEFENIGYLKHMISEKLAQNNYFTLKLKNQ